MADWRDSRDRKLSRRSVCSKIEVCEAARLSRIQLGGSQLLRIELQDMPENTGQAWDDHWQALDQTSRAFGVLSRLVRRWIFQPAVRYYLEVFFPKKGIFVEMGCGTAESSALIPAGGRMLCGLDFSLVALRRAKALCSLPNLACGDLFRLPFQDESVTGIWNLGVMEHFPPPDLHRILLEFRRVLQPGGVAVLFWPTEFNSSRWVLGPIEQLRTALSGRPYRFFPDEVSRLRSRSHAAEVMKLAGFDVLRTDFSVRTAYIHMVVVARKIAS